MKVCILEINKSGSIELAKNLSRILYVVHFPSKYDYNYMINKLLINYTIIDLRTKYQTCRGFLLKAFTHKSYTLKVKLIVLHIDKYG